MKGRSEIRMFYQMFWFSLRVRTLDNRFSRFRSTATPHRTTQCRVRPLSRPKDHWTSTKSKQRVRMWIAIMHTSQLDWKERCIRRHGRPTYTNSSNNKSIKMVNHQLSNPRPVAIWRTNSMRCDWNLSWPRACWASSPSESILRTLTKTPN